MAIAADPFASPKAIGQTVTPLVTPNYGSNLTTSPGTNQTPDIGTSPFGLGGALSQQADQSRAGLASLLQAAQGSSAGANPSLDAATGSIPVSDLGMPQLGGSPVSTAGTAGLSSPVSSATSLGGLSQLFGPDLGGLSTPSPNISTGLAASQGGRAFGEGSILSGTSGNLLGLGLGLGSTLLGIGPFGLGTPITLARGLETALDQAFGFPSNFTATTPQGETLQGQQSNTGFFGFGQPSRGDTGNLSLSDAARTAQAQAQDVEASSGMGATAATADTGVASEGQGAPGSGGVAGGGGGVGADSGVGGGDTGGMAAGGLVPGIGRGDIVPARLTPGEFVISAPAVRALGLARLMRENRVA